VKLVCKIRVKNDLGLHIRPATAIVKLLQNCNCDVTFTHKKEVINAKSILNILMLAAKQNSQITITADGEDAEQIINKLQNAFENRFGE